MIRSLLSAVAMLGSLATQEWASDARVKLGEGGELTLTGKSDGTLICNSTETLSDFATTTEHHLDQRRLDKGAALLLAAIIGPGGGQARDRLRDLGWEGGWTELRSRLSQDQQGMIKGNSSAYRLWNSLALNALIEQKAWGEISLIERTLVASLPATLAAGQAHLSWEIGKEPHRPTGSTTWLADSIDDSFRPVLWCRGSTLAHIGQDIARTIRAASFGKLQHILHEIGGPLSPATTRAADSDIAKLNMLCWEIGREIGSIWVEEVLAGWTDDESIEVNIGMLADDWREVERTLKTWGFACERADAEINATRGAMRLRLFNTADRSPAPLESTEFFDTLGRPTILARPLTESRAFVWWRCSTSNAQVTIAWRFDESRVMVASSGSGKEWIEEMTKLLECPTSVERTSRITEAKWRNTVETLRSGAKAGRVEVSVETAVAIHVLARWGITALHN